MGDANQRDAQGAIEPGVRKASTRPWQFSIRGLLFLTAIISGVLAFAVRMPAFFQILLIAAVPILIVIGLMQGANFATSDSRPRVAIVAWSLLGLFFALFTAALSRTLLHYEEIDWNSLSTLLFGISVMGGSFVVCVFQAYRAFTLVNPHDAVVVNRIVPKSNGLVMTASNLQFSLLGFLLTTTLIAVVMGAWSSRPIVAVIAMILASPLVFVAAMAALSNRKSAWARVAVFLILALAASILCFLLWLLVS